MAGRMVVLGIAAMAGCGIHSTVDCSDTIPCPDGMVCARDGHCLLILPGDGGAPTSTDDRIDASTFDASTGSCGDGLCSGKENCRSCRPDCGPCPFVCGDETCAGDLGEACGTCPLDCGPCPAACGDGTCVAPEGCDSCAADCGLCTGCGDGFCTGESCGSCPADCGPCGCVHPVCEEGPPLTLGCDPCVADICSSDGFCCSTAWDSVCVREATRNCSAGCGRCGDGFCGSDEGPCSCSTDCGPCFCSHSLCEEGPGLSALCNPCADSVCDVDSFCCTGFWDARCVSLVESECGETCGSCGDLLCALPVESCATCPTDCGACQPGCDDGTCGPSETCATCPADCGVCPGGCPDYVLDSITSVSAGGTTVDSGNDVGGASCGLPGSTAADRTYEFRAPVAGTYSIDTFGSAFDTLLYVRAGSCTGSELACNNDDGGPQSRIALTLDADETVTIIVDGFDADAGDYLLHIELL